MQNLEQIPDTQLPADDAHRQPSDEFRLQPKLDKVRGGDVLKHLAILAVMSRRGKADGALPDAMLDSHEPGHARYAA